MLKESTGSGASGSASPGFLGFGGGAGVFPIVFLLHFNGSASVELPLSPTIFSL